jgi:hypothetical protein
MPAAMGHGVRISFDFGVRGRHDHMPVAIGHGVRRLKFTLCYFPRLDRRKN